MLFVNSFTNQEFNFAKCEFAFKRKMLKGFNFGPDEHHSSSLIEKIKKVDQLIYNSPQKVRLIHNNSRISQKNFNQSLDRK